MQVSAITANTYPAYHSYSFVNVRGLEIPQEPASDTYTPSSKGNPNSDIHMFEEINDWKRFCHNQIAEGKLDYIV